MRFDLLSSEAPPSCTTNVPALSSQPNPLDRSESFQCTLLFFPSLLPGSSRVESCRRAQRNSSQRWKKGGHGAATPSTPMSRAFHQATAPSPYSGWSPSPPRAPRPAPPPPSDPAPAAASFPETSASTTEAEAPVRTREGKERPRLDGLPPAAYRVVMACLGVSSSWRIALVSRLMSRYVHVDRMRRLALARTPQQHCWNHHSWKGGLDHAFDQTWGEQPCSVTDSSRISWMGHHMSQFMACWWMTVTDAHDAFVML